MLCSVKVIVFGLVLRQEWPKTIEAQLHYFLGMLIIYLVKVINSYQIQTSKFFGVQKYACGLRLQEITFLTKITAFLMRRIPL